MRKIIIIRNKKTNRLTVKIMSIQDIDIVNGHTFIFTNNSDKVIFSFDNDYLIQNFTGNNLKIFNENYNLKHKTYF